MRQQVIATLGRYDELQANGQLERLLSAFADDSAAKIASRRIGRRWCSSGCGAETGCGAVMEQVAGSRKHGFALERAVFLTVLHRLFVSGSDRAADRWREDYRIAGIDGLWRGSARSCRRRSRMAARRSHRAASRIWWRSGCSRIGATCSRALTWCSWTLPVSTSKAPAARRWVATATARIIGPICDR